MEDYRLVAEPWADSLDHIYAGDPNAHDRMGLIGSLILGSERFLEPKSHTNWKLLHSWCEACKRVNFPDEEGVGEYLAGSNF